MDAIVSEAVMAHCLGSNSATVIGSIKTQDHNLTAWQKWAEGWHTDPGARQREFESWLYHLLAIQIKIKLYAL